MSCIVLTLATCASILAVSTGIAFAGPTCTTEPKAKWMPEAAMQAKAVALGFKIKTFKVSGSCYEIYGWNNKGQKAEVYFHPVSGAIIKAEIG